MSPTGSPRSEGLLRGSRRTELVRIAIELFSHNAYDDIFMADIAKAAGVAHGTLFYHFKDKRGLYLEVLRHVMARTLELNRSLPDEQDRPRQLKGALRRQIEYRRDHPQTMLALMRCAGQDHDVDAIFEESRRVAAVFIQELLGLVGEPSTRLRVAIRGCLGFVDEMTVDWLTHGQDGDIEELERLAFTAVVAILSSVEDLPREVRIAVDELLAALPLQ